jgi:hypothetical protein
MFGSLSSKERGRVRCFGYKKLYSMSLLTQHPHPTSLAETVHLVAILLQVFAKYLTRFYESARALSHTLSRTSERDLVVHNLSSL